MAATSSGRGIYFTPFTPLDGLIELTPIANMPRKPSSFRLNTKNTFLTYPDSSTWYPQADQHNSIQTFRELNPRPQVKSYIQKDGDVISWGEFQIDGRSTRGCVQSANDAYAEALNSGSKDQALQILKEKAPKNYILHYHHLIGKLGRIFKTTPKKYTPPFSLDSFNNVPDELWDWIWESELGSTAFPSELRENAPAEPLRHKSLVLEGDSRTGKTLWARALGKHNYLSGHLDLNDKVFSLDADYNIIDDVDPHYLKEFMGARWASNPTPNTENRSRWKRQCPQSSFAILVLIPPIKSSWMRRIMRH